MMLVCDNRFDTFLFILLLFRAVYLTVLFPFLLWVTVVRYFFCCLFMLALHCTALALLILCYGNFYISRLVNLDPRRPATTLWKLTGTH